MKYYIPPVMSLLAFSSGILMTPALAKENSISLPTSEVSAVETSEHFLNAIARKRDALSKLKSNDKIFETSTKELSEMLAQLENKTTLTAGEERIVIYTLNRLADWHCPTKIGFSSFSKTMFKNANLFKRREVALADRLHPDELSQILNHREVLNWYLDRGRKNEADNEIRFLSAKLKTNDPDVINPPSKTSGCGAVSRAAKIDGRGRLHLGANQSCGMG